jgi:hypothetical protein
MRPVALKCPRRASGRAGTEPALETTTTSPDRGSTMHVPCCQSPETHEGMDYVFSRKKKKFVMSSRAGNQGHPRLGSCDVTRSISPGETGAGLGVMGRRPGAVQCFRDFPG